MVKWTKTKEDNWRFDYSIFDRYIDVATKLGINGAINVYSLTPFLTDQEIHYYDEKLNTYKVLELNIHDRLYKDIWKNFLRDFKKHLIDKAFFERVYLGFDEKSEDDMNILHNVIEESAPEFLERLVLAGAPEDDKLAENLSISYDYFPNQKLERKKVVFTTIDKRNKENKLTTFYLCASPSHPNTLTYSPAIEGQMIPWLALKHKTSGYLRWAFNNWTDNPFENPVFIHAQGDDYQVYPGKNKSISSIRWELLKEGIEDYELFKIVKTNGFIPLENLNLAIELATRNQDGRYKEVNDIMKSRELLLEAFNR